MSEQKNYNDYGYVGDEKIEISVQEFIALRKALEKAMDNGTKVELPQVFNYFDVTKGTRIKKPTKKKLENENVKEFFDSEATFSEDNAKVSYDANLYPEVYNGFSLLMIIHNRNVEEGIAKHKDELKEHFEKQQQAKEDEPQMNVVKDE